MTYELRSEPQALSHRDAMSLSETRDLATNQILRLHRGMSCLPNDCSARTVTGNLSFMRRLGQRKEVLDLLQGFLANSRLLSEIANRSYRHTNHFDKIVLVDSGQHLGYRLTLHLWMPPYSEAELNDEQIHDHRFSFWSTVLIGRMAFQNYVRDATGVPFTEYQYIPEKLRESTVNNFYIDVGASPLLETAPSTANAGTTYFLPYNRIHRVVPSSTVTCTMVLRGPRQKNYASVFSTSKKYRPSANKMFSRTALQEKLLTIITGIRECSDDPAQ